LKVFSRYFLYFSLLVWCGLFFGVSFFVLVDGLQLVWWSDDILVVSLVLFVAVVF